MEELKWITESEIRGALGKISRSTLYRRVKELKLEEKGYTVRLGRRRLLSNRLITDLPTLLQSNEILTKEVENGK
ncbi:hypothetical protein AGMMS50268_06180 [Spirochaetia bacterium]|nr:hypothetical protein AGMMS50268_06180 [Spirochaetia bacterium]